MDLEAQHFILDRWNTIPGPGRCTEDQAMAFIMELVLVHPEIMQGYSGGLQQLAHWLLASEFEEGPTRGKRANAP
jgi:hypothetical protein